MSDKTKIIQRDLSCAVRTCKRVAKRVAKQHNVREFMYRVNPLQREVQNLLSDLLYEDAVAYHRISYKESELERFIETCWRYCQGDTRIVL